MKVGDTVYVLNNGLKGLFAEEMIFTGQESFVIEVLRPSSKKYLVPQTIVFETEEEAKKAIFMIKLKGKGNDVWRMTSE